MFGDAGRLGRRGGLVGGRGLGRGFGDAEVVGWRGGGGFIKYNNYLIFTSLNVNIR